MRRTLPALLLLFSLVLTLAACTPRPPAVTAEEVLPAARALLEASKPVNQAFVGDGIPVPTGAGAVGAYFPADEGWLTAHGDRKSVV